MLVSHVTRIIHLSRPQTGGAQSFGATQVLASNVGLFSFHARVLLPHLTSAACAILKAVASTEN